MKLLPAFLFLFATLPALHAELPEKGDSYDRVIELMGEPSGLLSIGVTRYMYYERGSVVLKDGKVAEIDLVSDEEFAKRKAKEAADAKALAEAEAAAEKKWAEGRAERIEEGLLTKEKMLASLEFQTMTVEQRVNLWRRFMKKYPEVPVAREYLADLQVYEEVLAQRKREAQQEQRMAELERRVRGAEARAARAEQDAARAEHEVRHQSERRHRYYTPIYYPYIVRRPNSSRSTGGGTVTPRSPNELKRSAPPAPRTVVVDGTRYDPTDRTPDPTPEAARPATKPYDPAAARTKRPVSRIFR